jgi:predicted RNA-binding protein YlxR (DUF448 family)
VRIAASGARLIVDRKRRLPGRGAYVHPRTVCVTAAGLARAFRRAVSAADVSAIVTEMSRTDDNSEIGDGERVEENPPGLGHEDAVESPPRFKAKDGRSIDARL